MTVFFTPGRKATVGGSIDSHREEEIFPLMSLPSLAASHFNLEKTLSSGQVFHWMPHNSGFAGAIGEKLAYLEQSGDTLSFSGSDANSVARYLALDHPIEQILNTFPGDNAMKLAAEYSAGIRIIRQPVWECLATFLTSAMKQVFQIRGISLAIRSRFGQRLQLGDLCAFSYPSPEILAAVRLEQLIECKLGFRAQNLLSTARMVAGGERLIWKHFGYYRPRKPARRWSSCRVSGKRLQTACFCLLMKGLMLSQSTFGSRVC